MLFLQRTHFIFMKKIIIIGSAVGLAALAVKFYSDQIALLKELEYSDFSFKLKAFSFNEVVVEITMKIYSKSRLEAKITDLNLDVFVEGKKWGTINETNPIIIPAKAFSIITLDVAILPKTIAFDFVNLSSQIQAKKDAEVIINGYAKVQTAFIKTNIPFEHKTTVRDFFSSE